MNGVIEKEEKIEKKETNLAYGGSALIEGIMMRGSKGYAYTIKKEDGNFHKEKKDYVAIGKRFKFLGLPFIRGIAGFFENMVIGITVLNRSAEIALPDEEGKPVSNLSLFLAMALALGFAVGIFMIFPYFLTSVFRINHDHQPFMYNLVSASIRMIFFFLYLVLISLMKDTKRLFAYHGAEHKTIHTYESSEDLTVENVKKHSRLHPRCGTSFLFIVLLITIVVFPFLNIIIIGQPWYQALGDSLFGGIIKKLIILLSHIVIGMPIVASISYELLKLSGKHYKNIIVKIFVAPGLFFQLFTTREPDDDMIKAGILSLNMVLGKEDVTTPRSVNDVITTTVPLKNSFVTSLIMIPLNFMKYFE
jgi:uncharacterized protein YqhQ